jgi:DNA modification methylase
VENFELNKCYNESNLVTMAKMPDNFIDLTVTSPPYDNLRDYKGYSFPFEDIAKELYRVTKQGGVLVWVVSDQTINGSETGTSFKQALYFKEIGFNLHDTMIYAKNNPVPYYHNRYNPSFEYMFIFSKGKPKTFNPLYEERKTKGYSEKRTFRYPDGSLKPANTKTISDKKLKNNIWFYTVGGKTNLKAHPATFPEQLAQDHIISWSNENDIVYDCFMGSGTTAKAAISANRKWVGSEISEEYCKIIEKRLQPLMHNLFT